jgi:hypothetical protein
VKAYASAPGSRNTIFTVRSRTADDKLLGWLRESHQQMGMQERLAER